MGEGYIQVKSRTSKAKFIDHVRIITSSHVTLLFFYGQGREWIRDYEYVNILIPKTEPRDHFVLQFTNKPDLGSYKLVGRQRSSPFVGFRKAKRILGIDDGRYRCEYDPDKKQCIVFLNEKLDVEVY
jgi:predicted secreted hydrolase